MKKIVTVISLVALIIIGSVTATVLSFAEETKPTGSQENMVKIAIVVHLDMHQKIQ